MPTPFLTMFFDTSFLSEAPLEDLRYAMEYPGPKYITDGVDREIKEGYANNPNDKRFLYIFEKNRKLKSKIKIISLGKCIKDSSMVDFSQRNILVKRNSLLCSAYYAWLPYAINPSIVTDPFRHIYNDVLHTIRGKGDTGDKLSMLLGNLRQKEIDGVKQIRKEKGYTGEGFDASVLKTARKKRLKDFKGNTLKLTDYQIVLGALLYLCTERSGPVIFFTCDKDLADIRENLMRSAIEKYTVNLILTEKLKRVNYNLKIFGELKFLYTTEIFDELDSTFKKIKDSDLFCGLQVAYYDRSAGKVYGHMNKVPIWLMNFFLEYKMNIDCYSVYKEIELKYPIKYVMDPTKSTKKIYFDITMRKGPHYDGFMPNCEDRCLYARKESGNPLDLSGFA